ncbi:hypothetical protein RBU61_14345 [Tissierella sp. MB52-C2]|uniref:hypothetical protein n=1 Tax=Tissierella sp. MB52-C2 TaxID=3070999 RepID=UPI00280BEEFE|nr:hypothetical protein [Tissierella sp. MB52-C2]WMM24095.1 hypothetical protein RBU61_14345 [Tissierella sp. MB52-C2]
MNYEFWVEAEKFLYDAFFLRLILLGIVLTFIIIRLTFIGKENSKVSNIILSIFIAFFIIFGIDTTVKFNKYKELYNHNISVNYGIRNNRKTFFRYDYPGHWEKNIYSTLYLVDSFRSVGIYEEEILTQDVEFLGRDDDNFYFQDKDQIISRKLGDHLEIVDDISTPLREGVIFHLIDPRFENIGFKLKSPYTYLLNYKIPKSESNKKFENIENLKVAMESEVTSGWLNPLFSNILQVDKRD